MSRMSRALIITGCQMVYLRMYPTKDSNRTQETLEKFDYLHFGSAQSDADANELAVHLPTLGTVNRSEHRLPRPSTTNRCVGPEQIPQVDCAFRAMGPKQFVTTQTHAGNRPQATI